MKAQAYVYRGQWRARCPKCGAGNQIHKTDKTFICLGYDCNPGILAMAFAQKPNNIKLFVPVPDLEVRAAAREKAIKEGREYEIEFAYPPEKVEALLRPRNIENMNWNYPDKETLEDLRRENNEHGIKVKR